MFSIFRAISHTANGVIRALSVASSEKKSLIDSCSIFDFGLELQKHLANQIDDLSREVVASKTK